MTAAGTHVVLLDTGNQYGRFHDLLKPDLFSRFIDTTTCVRCILASVNVCELHFFLPCSERALIGDTIGMFKKSKFYVSCVDQQTVNEVKNAQYHPMISVEAFHARSLAICLFEAALLCLTAEVQSAVDDPDRQDALRQDKITLLRLIIEEELNNIHIRDGVQPNDHL